MASLTVGRILSSLADSIKAVVRGGARGATVEADVTSTVIDADHQALDVAVKASALPSGAATEASLVFTRGKFAPGIRTTKAGQAVASGAIHTPAAGQRIRLYWIGLATSQENSAENLVIVRFAAGAAIYRWPMGAPGAFSHWEAIEGAADEALVLTLSNAQPIEWNVTFEEFA